MEKLEKVVNDILNMEARIENTIIKNLIQNDTYTRKVITYQV